jgi:hypothetical protein
MWGGRSDVIEEERKKGRGGKTRERDVQRVTFALKHEINRPGTGVYNPATASLG